MVQTRDQGGAFLTYYSSKKDIIYKNILAEGGSYTIGDDIVIGNLHGITQWKILSYGSIASGAHSPTNPDIIYVNGETLPKYDGNGMGPPNIQRYSLYSANSECCPDSTQLIGLSYDMRNDIRAGSIILQTPPPRFSSYSTYYQMRMAKAARN